MTSLVLLICLLGVTFGSPTALKSGPLIKNNARDHKQTRITNGRDAQPGEYPYVVANKFEDGGFWGASSIITPTWVLTAGHICIVGMEDKKVYTSSVLLSQGGLDFEIIDVFISPLYDYNNNLRGDICLLHLNDSIPLGPNAQQITLPPQGFEVPDNSPAVLTGWGAMEDGDAPDNLKVTTEYYVISADHCENITQYGYARYETVICSNGKTGEGVGQGACPGDSGSPLVYKGVQVGIMSAVYSPCGIGPMPEYSAKVSYFTSWIQETLGPDAAQLKIADASDLL